MEDLRSDDQLDRAVAREVGPEVASVWARIRRVQEEHAQERRPDEGLRERKRRLTRQRISDVATALAMMRGFDNVTVAKVAEIVGVSEKTVYNYFPTKESMILDMADEAVERLAAALRNRDPDESLTSVVLRAIRQDDAELAALPDDFYEWLPRFGELLSTTPSLRAAWLGLHSRLVDVAAEELAASAGVDPRDPEPMIAARGLVGLSLVAMESRTKHIRKGLRGQQLTDAVNADLDRAARLLETGLWLFNVLAQRRSRAQLEAAQKAFERARRQVVAAIKQARGAYREARESAQR